MNHNGKRAGRTFNKIALLQGVVFIFLSLFAGVVCPFIARLVHFPDDGAPWQASLLFGLNWYWTLPVGIVLAVLIIWISNKLPEKARVIFGFFTSMVLLAFALFLTWLLLSV
jgi:hypothetical protein